MYRTFVFDLDGTLLDTSPGVLSSLRETEAKMDLEPLPQEKLIQFIGPPMIETIPQYYPLDAGGVSEYLSIFRKDYRIRVTDAHPYEGMLELLQMIREKGGRIGIATMKVTSYAQDCIEATGIAPYVDTLQGYSDASQPSKASLILKVLEALGEKDRSKVLMTGDSLIDQGGAREAGVDFAGVTFGFGFNGLKDEETSDWVCRAQSTAELWAFIETHIEKR